MRPSRGESGACIGRRRSVSAVGGMAGLVEVYGVNVGKYEIGGR